MTISWNNSNNGMFKVTGVGPTGPMGPTGLSYSGLTSSTSIAVSTGSKIFTTNLASTAVAFVVGQRVRVASSASPANWMEGSITAFTGTSMTVNVDLVGGSGTLASWNISIAGAQGVSGATGATGSSYYDIAISYGGTPTANEEILRHRVARAFTMPATGHKGSCGTNPGSSTGFVVRKNGSTIGTVTFATNGTVTLTSFVATSFAADDIITIVAPASLNSIANIGITLLGTI